MINEIKSTDTWLSCGSPMCQDEFEQAAVQKFRQQGALWIKGLLDREFVGELREVYAKRYESKSQKELKRRFAVVGDSRFMITLKVAAPFNAVALYANPVLMKCFAKLLGDDFRISSFGSVVAFPGAAAQSVHCDYPPLFESPEICSHLPPHAISLMIPLVDLDQKTGATALWEGSHTSANCRAQLKELHASDSWDGATMPAARQGDVYLMDFRLIHRGMANMSPISRPVIYIVYCRPWFREDLNFPEQPAIRISRKQLARVPKKWRHLFSFARPID